MRGETVGYVPDDEGQRQLCGYGLIRVEDNCVAVSNRVFEMCLYTYFIGESGRNNDLR